MKTGIYIHIPFCLTKCGYCSFFSVPYSREALDRYVETLLEEIRYFRKGFNFVADTVYFGGGTPSLLSAGQINTIVELIEPAGGAEITLETNPVQITPDWVRTLRTSPVNRLSLGVQSMFDENLVALGRKHKADSLSDRMKLLRDSEFANISLDLMYGLPWFTRYSPEDELERYLALQPEHISTYLLSIEDHVPYSHWQKILPDDVTTEKQYIAICRGLERAGFIQYELSNFSLPGRESRHNLHYWLDEDYIGLGAGASGFIRRQRYKKPEDIELWTHSVQRGDILYELESETKAQQKTDFIIMQFRLTRGLDPQAYKERFGTDFVTDYHDTLERFIASGHILPGNGFFQLAPKARFVSNHILQEFA